MCYRNSKEDVSCCSLSKNSLYYILTQYLNCFQLLAFFYTFAKNNNNYMATLNYTAFDNEVQEENKQCLIEELLANNKMLSQAQAKEIVSDIFVPDGLMNNGKYYIDEVGNVRRAPSGHEKALWGSSEQIRIMYLTKELNAGNDRKDTYDIRQDSFCVPVNYIDKYHFETKLEEKKGLNKMVAYTLHGMIHILSQPQEPFLEYDKITIYDVKETLIKHVFARINIKSTGGANSSNDKEVLHEAQKYSSNTIKRIKNLRPKIIVCCGNQHNKNFILEDFLNNNGFHFVWTDVQGIWIDKEYDIIAIDSYHLSYVCYGYSEHNMYNDIVGQLYKYIVKTLDNVK